MQYTDIRARRCANCTREYIPPGAGDGCCSDRCWIRARRQVAQPERLARSWTGLADRAERHAAASARVDAVLADARLDGDIRRWRRERGETLGLIARMQGRDTGYAIRGSRAEREQMAQITRAASSRKPRRVKGSAVAAAERLGLDEDVQRDAHGQRMQCVWSPHPEGGLEHKPHGGKCLMSGDNAYRRAGS